MIPMPSELPEWATLDIQDPISGQYNVVTPPAEVKLEGWRLGEKPNRQWWNWFNRTVYDWINYFNSNLNFSGQTFTPVWDGLDLASLTTNYGIYSRQGNIVFFTISVIWVANTSTANMRMMNLPLQSQTGIDFIQTVKITRGSIPTLAGQGVLSGIINDNTTIIDLWTENTSTGVGSEASPAGATGELTISGFYFIEV